MNWQIRNMRLVEVTHPSQSGVEVIQLEEVFHNVGTVPHHRKCDRREGILDRRDDAILLTHILVEKVYHCT